MTISFFVQDFPSYTQTFVLQQIAGVIENRIPTVIYATRDSGLTGTHGLIRKHRMLDKTIFLPKIPEAPRDRINAIFSLYKKPGWVQKYKLLVKAINPFKYGRDAISLKLAFQCLPFLDKSSFEILHSQFGWLGAAVCNFRRLGIISGKLITSFRGADTEMYLKKNPNAYQKLFRYGDLFLPVCNYFKQWLITNGCPENKIEVLRSGIDLREFTFNVRRFPKYGPVRLLSVARMVEKKGLHFGLEAVARLKQSGNDIIYTIIGEGPLRSKLEQQASEMGIRNIVFFPGMKPHSEVLSEIQTSHILLAPSITSSNGDREGIPNVLKEAMATGMPVVSTWHSGIPELVTDQKTGFLVPEKDVSALENRLQLLIDNPQLWAQMGQTGRSTVEKHYDIRLLNARLLEFYQILTDPTGIFQNI